MVIPPQFYHLSSFSDGLAAVQVDGENGKWGYIDKTGKMVITPQFNDADDFKRGLAAVRVGGKDGKWGYIDKTGKMDVPPRFDSLDQEDFQEYFDDDAGLTPAKVDGKYGFIYR